MAETFTVNNLTISLHAAPPVYDPGGPVAAVTETDEPVGDQTLEAVEKEGARRGAVLLIVPCRREQVDLEGLLNQRGFQAASAWFRGATASASRPTSSRIRLAKAEDVPTMLAIGEAARHQKARYSPVFWKMTTSPKETFAPYITLQVESERNVALVYEEQGTVVGFCIAQNDYVDDFAVAAPPLWETVGQELLHAAGDAAHKRGISHFIIVAPDADNNKCGAIMAEGFTRFRRWYVKPLDKGEKGS